MDWAAIAAVTAAVTAVVTAIAAVTGELAKLWAADWTPRDEPEQRLRRATTPDEARGVFLDAGRDGIQSLKALDIDIAAGHFAQVSSSEDVARAEQQVQTVRKKSRLCARLPRTHTIASPTAPTRSAKRRSAAQRPSRTSREAGVADREY